MKKFIITALCICTALFTFANPAATDKKKHNTATASILNAVVTTTGTNVIITAVSETPGAVAVTLTDDAGNELYQGKLVKGNLTQHAVFNLEQLEEGTYSIVLSNGKSKLEKKVTVNTNTIRQLSVE
ncbi:hypothetical protein FC093_00905 [Ilyomonas limi]|uniref:T9SS type A sorting domain-containing protein n=1 Tax=Ilyomonas limi TaxID=2575867 RepID=A0A4U3LAY2_9BACT|nr:hypothetical protein [Ilyomonas limi]TKK71614.1 hypothetical protein FC093_00905 [Ilyomonas limi]